MIVDDQYVHGATAIAPALAANRIKAVSAADHPRRNSHMTLSRGRSSGRPTQTITIFD
jgi:hypothetical protein